MQLAVSDMFSAKWTDEIHEEWMRNLLENRADLRREQLERTRDLMNAHVQDCLVTGHQGLIPALTLPDPKDRHVLAAAIQSGSNVIVAFNLKHFPENVLTTYGIDAQHPDEFVRHLLDLAAACRVCGGQASTREPQESSQDR